MHTYGRNPVVLEKGHGLYAEGPEGQKYLDFTSGIEMCIRDSAVAGAALAALDEVDGVINVVLKQGTVTLELVEGQLFRCV